MTVCNRRFIRLIPEKEKTSLHLLNGRRLVSYYGMNEQQERIFEIVNQWNLGAALLTDKKEKAYLGDSQFTGR